MTTFELEKEIKEKLYRALASEVITPDELESLPVRLGCLALNLIDADMEEEGVSFEQALKWLLYRRTEVPLWLRNRRPELHLPGLPSPEITAQQQSDADRILKLALKFEFLKEEKELLFFKDDKVLFYFCAVYCMNQPIENDILNRINPDNYYMWSDLDLNLPEKVWQFIRDGNEDKEYNASSLLMMIGESTLRRDKSLWWELIKEQTVTLLLEGLKEPVDFVRGRAASILSDIHNPRLVEPFLETLFDSNPDVRAAIAIGLGNLEVIRAVPSLIELLEDEDGFVRQRAVFALSYIKDPTAVEPLIETLLYDEDAGAIAAMIIGQFKDSRTVEPLIKVLEEDWVELREYAAQSLGEIGDKRAIEPLSVLLNDEEENVVASAASALLLLGDSRGFQLMTDFILKAANSPENHLRQSWRVADILGKSGDQRAVEPLLVALPFSYSNLKDTIIIALGELGNPAAIEPLIKELDNKEPLTRARAAEALGKLAAEKALSKLEYLAKNDKSNVMFWVKEAALEAIEQIRKAVQQHKEFPNLFPTTWQN